jgi:hypothetical protein
MEMEDAQKLLLPLIIQPARIQTVFYADHQIALLAEVVIIITKIPEDVPKCQEK